MADLRLDKWLWAARLYKTRTLAARAVDLGRVWVNDLPAKSSRELHAADRIGVQQAGYRLELTVLLLSTHRGGAALARTLYAETPQSVAAREQALAQRRLAPNPADATARPTKRDRRALAQWERWSARVDD